jgi:predicted protein tyrosine phosphatase
MIKDIIIYNRFFMNLLVNNMVTLPYNYWYLISIFSDEIYLTDKNHAILKSRGMIDGISLNFDDIELNLNIPILNTNENAIIFNKDMAQKIINFLDKIKNDLKIKEITLVAHCDAGISRSGAIGEFACDYLDFPYDTFKERNKGLHPNILVLNTLRQTAKMTPEEENKDDNG